MLSSREKRIFLFTAGLIVLSVLFSLFIEPLVTRNSNLNKEITVNSMRLKKYTQLVSQKDYLETKYNEYAFASGDELAGKDTILGILAEIEALAKRNNIRILDIRPETPSASKGKARLNKVEIRTEADIEGLLKFTYDIETSTSLLKIVKLQLNSKPTLKPLRGSLLFPSYLLQNKRKT